MTYMLEKKRTKLTCTIHFLEIEKFHVIEKPKSMKKGTLCMNVDFLVSSPTVVSSTKVWNRFQRERDQSSELAKRSHRRVTCFSSTLPLFSPFTFTLPSKGWVTLSRLRIFSFSKTVPDKRKCTNTKSNRIFKKFPSYCL